jgi:hypothetical protein
MHIKKFFLSLVVLGISLGLSLLAAEWFFRPGHTAQRARALDIFVPDAELGHAGKPKARGVEVFSYPDQSRREAHYSLDAEGFRVVPGARPSGKCLLLMGDSISFGLGVEDEETAAAILQRKLLSWRVVNLSLIGWGAHQALRILESHREAPELQGCVQLRSYFFSQIDHVRRAAGRAIYDLAGPKYILRDGKLSHAGTFHSLRMNYLINAYLNRSEFAKRLLLSALGSNELREGEMERYLAILSEMNRVLASRYQSPLSVIYFTFGHEPNEHDRALRGAGIRTIFFDEKAGARPVFLKRFYLPDECHPSAEGHERISDLRAGSREF